MFLDSAGCHPYDLKGRYSNVKLVFFPVHCTSELQPLDLGISQNFKGHYRQLLLRFIITMTSSERNTSEISKSLNVLQAMKWVGEAWHNGKVTTISKCFNSGGISSNALIEDEEADPFSDLDDIDEDLKTLIKVSPQTTITPYTCLLSDTKLPICYCMDNEKELLDSLVINGQVEVGISDDNDDDDDDDDDDNDDHDIHEVTLTTSLKSYHDVARSVRDVEVFLIQCGLVMIASEFACLSSTVAAHALKKQSHQKTLDEYFLHQ